MEEKVGTEGSAEKESGVSGRVRLQVPSIILPSSQSITVLSPVQQQQLGLDITQLISGQQLHLLASHLSDTSSGQSSQPVIIIPEAVDDGNEASSSTFTTHRSVEADVPAGTSYEITVDVPPTDKQSSSTVTNSSIRRGRPNKFVTLDSGEIVRQEKPLVKNGVPKRPRGRPRKEKEAKNRPNSIETREQEEHTDINSQLDKDAGSSSAGNHSPQKRIPKRLKRRRISDSDSDYNGGEVATNLTRPLSESDGEEEVIPPSRPVSLRSQSLRRSVVKNTRYADYEVEDLPARPENVWIKENGVLLEDTDAGTKSQKNPLTEGSYPETEDNDVIPEEITSDPFQHISIKKTPIKRRGKTKRPGPVRQKLKPAVEFEMTENESKELVTCGACNTQMPRKTYLNHQNKQHNGLSWIEGEENPIDFRDSSIENQNYLSNLIREAFTKKGGVRGKVNGGFRQNGKFLECEKCEHRAFSAPGYLSHIRFCCVSEEERIARMWCCPLCQRSMMPSSRYSHEQAHKQNKIKLAEKEVDDEETLRQMMTAKPGPVKKKTKKRRAAAVKAESFMQEMLDQDNPNLASTVDPLKLGFRRPKETTRGIGSVKAVWIRQLKEGGPAMCRYPGCEFSCMDLVEMQKHHTEECTLKPSEVFECVRCTMHCPTEAEMVDHVSQAHGDAKVLSESEPEADSENFSAFEESSAEDVSQEKKRSKKTSAGPEKSGCTMGMGYSLRCMMPYWTFRNKVPYRPVLKWMLEFCSRHHSQQLLFPSLVATTKIKLLQQSEKYKPSTEYSVSFTTAPSSHPTVNAKFILEQKWTSMPTFSGTSEGDVPLFFTGGPVSALAWCPLPVVLGEDQLLAVSCHQSMDSMPPLSEASSAPGLIQVWSLGALDNAESCPSSPRLLLGLGHQWGFIRQLAWCPSGCWDPSKGLHGLIAAACADGTVRLFPVPNCGQQQLFIEAQASLTLLPHSLPERKSPCLRVSWYPCCGHSVIAGGFADGLVCLWKVGSSSQLLQNTNSDNGEQQLYAYLKFHAHSGPVTALALSPMGEEEPRYLFTGGLAEKNMTYWDLEKVGEISLGNFNRRARITDSTWMSLWPSAVSTFEDLQLGTTFIPPRNFCRHFMILPHNSSALSVDKGDWLNGIAQGTIAGEVTLLLLNQVIFGMDNEKQQRDKRALLTRTCIANVSIREEALSFEEAKKDTKPTFLTYKEAGRRGVIFCDIKLDSDHVWCKESKCGQLPENMDSSPSVNYPLTAVNHVAWNPNASSFGWLAVGYQCGIVRAIHVKCKSSDQILKSSLHSSKQAS